jgi:hypothetical protein
MFPILITIFVAPGYGVKRLLLLVLILLLLLLLREIAFEVAVGHLGLLTESFSTNITELDFIVLREDEALVTYD